MDDSAPPAPSSYETTLVIAFGAVGVLVSWFYFLQSAGDYGFVEFWEVAFTSHPISTGLHWDLVCADAAIITIAWIERARIGVRSAILVTFMGLVLGVCAAIPTYWLARRRSEGAAE